MVELNSMAKWVLDLEGAPKNNGVTSFITHFYKELLKKGHGHMGAKIDCSTLDDALDELEEELDFDQTSPIEVLRVIIDQLQLGQKMDLFSINLHGKASCPYFHAVEMTEKLQSGLIVTDLRDISANIKSYMNDMQYNKLKKTCKECGNYQSRLQWKIKRFPQVLILRTVLEDYKKDINLELDLDLDDYNFYT